MKKHIHKFQFVERYSSVPLWKLKVTDIDNPADLEYKCIDWTKPTLKFACDCGKTKLVNEK